MNPGDILDTLSSKSKKDSNYQHQRLYRNLYNKEFYLYAYGQMASKTGNMTPGSDGKTIDGFRVDIIDNIISVLKNETYRPLPATRTYIPKKNSTKKRPLGIPAVYDKLLQQVIAELLKAIYENIFSDSSHGFRPQRSCHTALEAIKYNFQGTHWFIEGDIKGFFDNIDHDVLINLLRKRIKDERFIRLIRKFLNAGYVEDWKFHNTYSGTPQGGIISPILANIYLHEFDVYMEKYKETFDKGKSRKRNTEYKKYDARIQKAQKVLENKGPLLSANERKAVIQRITESKKAQLAIPAKDQMDDSYKRLQYVRYADDFIVGIIGSKGDADKVKEDISEFLKNQLKLELSKEKTLITNTKNPARFLSYEIFVSRDNVVKKVNGVKKRTKNGMVMLKMPSQVIKSKLLEYGAIKIINKPGEKETWKATHRPFLIRTEAYEIFARYNAEIRGLYNYYNLAYNVSYMHKFAYHMKYSLAKTLANKFRIHKTQVFKRFRNISDNKFGVHYNTKKGRKFLEFYDNGFRKVSSQNTMTQVDLHPNTFMYGDHVGVVKRLLAEKCEWCGAKGIPLEIHHIKKMKELKGKKRWEQVMIGRKRKTMALCVKCHDDLHAGKLD